MHSSHTHLHYHTGILPELQSSRTNNFSVNLDDTEGGFLQTSFIIAFMLLSPIFGYFGDRYKRKYLIAFGLTLWSIFVLVGSFSVVRNKQLLTLLAPTYTLCVYLLHASTELWHVSSYECFVGS